MTTLEIFVLALATIGVLFMNISALGMLRMPDVYAQMHAAGKAATLGVSCVLLAAGIFYGAEVFWRMLILIVLFFVTAPIATTSMARAAYRSLLDEPFVLSRDDMAREYPKKSGSS